MRTLLNLILVFLFLVSCQTVDKLPPSHSNLAELKKQTPNHVTIKAVDPVETRKLLLKFRKILRQKKTLSQAEWKIHDKLLDAYISLKYLGKDKVIQIPPKTQLTLRTDSFCLNPRRAIPVGDDPYYLTKKKIIPYQNKLILLASKHAVDKNTIQEIIWNLQNRVNWENFPKKHKSILKRIDPKAPILLPSKLREALKDNAKEYLSEQLKLPDLEEFISGQFYRYNEYTDHLEKLKSSTKKPKNIPMHIEDTPLYSLSESESYKNHQLTFYNPGSKSVSMDLSKYSLIPLRKDVQPLGAYPDNSPNPSLLSELEAVLFDLMLRTGVGTTPVIGDLIDLYEVLSQKDFFTGETLTAEERLMSAWGLMAGSGQTYRMAKKGMSAPPRYIKDLSKKYQTFTDPKQAKAIKKLANQIDGKVPNDWPVEPSKIKTRRGKIKHQGLIFKDPNNKNNSIRFMPKDHKSKFPHQRKPYVVVKKNGKTLNKDSVSVSKHSPEAHIPVNEFNFNKFWKR